MSDLTAETAKKISDLLDSVGLPSPSRGEVNATWYPKILDALEKLVAVARAAAASRWSCEAIDLVEALDELNMPEWSGDE